METTTERYLEAKIFTQQSLQISAGLVTRTFWKPVLNSKKILPAFQPTSNSAPDLFFK